MALGLFVALIAPMTETEFPKEKLGSPDLRELARTGSPDTVSVIIELDVPVPQVEFGKLVRQGLEVLVPTRIAPEDDEQRRESERKEGEAVVLLDRALKSKPHFIRAANAFVATVDGQELRRIARSPLFKAIRPNRKLT